MAEPGKQRTKISLKKAWGKKKDKQAEEGIINIRAYNNKPESGSE